MLDSGSLWDDKPAYFPDLKAIATKLELKLKLRHQKKGTR
jgi:hypothetical protein